MKVLNYQKLYFYFIDEFAIKSITFKFSFHEKDHLLLFLIFANFKNFSKLSKT